ncbi:hypothetical protein Bbelb_317560 [Branchiostoma belcheri]|nr:hypothetical protein Bbelb_317560 [Branchiostoma belcheri]
MSSLRQDSLLLTHNTFKSAAEALLMTPTTTSGSLLTPWYGISGACGMCSLIAHQSTVVPDQKMFKMLASDLHNLDMILATTLTNVFLEDTDKAQFLHDYRLRMQAPSEWEAVVYKTEMAVQKAQKEQCRRHMSRLNSESGSSAADDTHTPTSRHPRKLKETTRLIATQHCHGEEAKTRRPQHVRQPNYLAGAHQLRTVNQDEARLDVIAELNEHNVLITQDWAMKFIPQKYLVHNPAAKRRGDAGCPITSLRPRAGLTPTPRIHTFLELTTVPRFLKNARPEAGDTVQLFRHAEPSTRRFRTPQALHAVSDHLVAFTGAVNSLASSPHIVYVELAHNDLCRQYLSPRKVAHELASLVRDILEIPSVHTVIVGEPIWRLRLPPYMRDFHARVREFSQTLRPLIDSIPNTTTWRHCKLWQKNPDYFVADGLHLSDFGNLRYYKSIRYAILPHLPAR